MKGWLRLFVDFALMYTKYASYKWIVGFHHCATMGEGTGLLKSIIIYTNSKGVVTAKLPTSGQLQSSPEEIREA